MRSTALKIEHRKGNSQRRQVEHSAEDDLCNSIQRVEVDIVESSDVK